MGFESWCRPLSIQHTGSQEPADPFGDSEPTFLGPRAERGEIVRALLTVPNRGPTDYLPAISTVAAGPAFLANRCSMEEVTVSRPLG